jgi:CRP-like cAMP-binding protein
LSHFDTKNDRFTKTGSGQTKEKLRKESGVSGWVDVAGINDASHAVKYLWSVYWAITVLSTVGYGDVVAHTNYEKGFSIVAELFGCIIFATLIGGLGSIMMSKKLLDQKVEYQLEELREFGRVKKLPKSLQKRMRLILEEAYRQTAFDEHKVLAQLPAAMQKEVHEHIYESMLAMMPLFQNLPESESEVLKQLLSAFKPLVVQPFDPVYEEHTPAFDFFVIISGEITLTREGGSTSRVLKKGSFFGERELFYSRRFGAGNQGPLPLVGRKRHQTAIVSSRARAELKFISWPQVMALRRTSRTIFEKIREAAMIRANADEDFKTQEQRRNVLDTLFVQFDAQNFSAKVIQRRWREFSNVRALKKIAVKTDRQLLEMLVQGMSRTEEKLQTVERRLELIEQDRIAGAPRPVT